MNPIPLPEKTARKISRASFEDTLRNLQPRLDALPVMQCIPALPPSEECFEETTTALKKAGLVISPNTPNLIAVGRELLDRTQLREGRVGALNNRAVLTFMYKYPSKGLQTLVIHAVDDVPLMELGKGIWWGLLSNVPLTVVDTEILSMETFFKINSVDLSSFVPKSLVDRIREESETLAVTRITQVEEEKKELVNCYRQLQGVNVSLKEQLKRSSDEIISENGRAAGWILCSIVLAVLLILSVIFICVSWK